MGRIKDDGRGGWVYDPNDEGPDQSGGRVDPTTLAGWGGAPTPPPTAQAAAPPAAPGANPDPNRYEQGRTYNEMSGWNTAKLNDLSHSGAKYDFARAVQTLGTSGADARGNLGAITDWLNTRGYPGAKVVGADKIDFGQGPVDVLTSNNQWWWNPTGGQGGANAAGAGGMGLPGAPGAGAAPATFGAAAAGGRQGSWGMGSPQGGALFDLLMQRAQQSLNVNPNDPIIKGQVDAYSAAQGRQRQSYLRDLAEKEGPNANIGMEGRMTSEAAGQATSAFQAQQMSQELAARRQEIESALSGAAGLLTAEQAMDLQYELAQLDIQQRSLDRQQQASQFSQGQAQNASQFAQRLAQQAFEFDTNSQNTVFGS